MKRTDIILLFTLVTGVFTPAAHAEERNIAFVNLNEVFTEFYKTKLTDTQLNEQAEEFNVERKELVADYEKLQDELNAAREEAQNTALSEAGPVAVPRLGSQRREWLPEWLPNVIRSIAGHAK